MDYSRIRLIGLDLDGTAFTTDKRITPETQSAIADAIAAGIDVIPASGRPLNGMPREFVEIPGVRYILGSNGAFVWDMIEKRFAVHSLIPTPTVLKAYDLFTACDCDFEVYVDGRPYTAADKISRADYYFPDPYIRAYALKTRVRIDDLRDFLSRQEGAEKLNISFPAQEEKKKGLEIAARLPELAAASGIPTNIEMTRGDVNKGEGLMRLAEALGLKPENVMAVGDHGNDIPMIRMAGVGVAMANALFTVKAEADVILPWTNDEEGAAKLLRRAAADRKAAGPASGGEV